jgi:hypothetical protein
MLALACLAFFAKKYVSTFSVHIKNTFDTMVSSSIYQDPRADISPPIMSRSRSEALPQGPARKLRRYLHTA